MARKYRGPHNVTPSPVSERSSFRRKWHEDELRRDVKMAIRKYESGELDPDDHIMPRLVPVGGFRYHRDED